jgi:hypothetical protein
LGSLWAAQTVRIKIAAENCCFFVNKKLRPTGTAQNLKFRFFLTTTEFAEGLLKMPALFDFLRALRASAVQSPSPASQKSLKTRDLEEKD